MLTEVFIVFTTILIIFLFIIKVKKSESWGRGWGRGWRRGWRRGWPRRYDYPIYSEFRRPCINDCCDYDECLNGRGCRWKKNGEWINGSYQECLRQKN